MRSADLSGSDPAFVGLMLRCGEPDLEVLPVVIPPLPPRAKPRVTVGTGPDSATYDAVVTPPGSAILLPGEATTRARAGWHGARSLRIEIAEGTGTTTIRGVVPLDGYAAALSALITACAGR